jgi:hypothetical protein
MSESGTAEAPWTNPAPEEERFRETFDPTYIRAFADQLAAIGMYELGFRPSGTEAGHQASERIAREMARVGLKNTRREPFPVYAWGFRGARIQLHGEQDRIIPALSFPPTPGTPAAGLSARLVDIGLGTAADYLGRDVKGKLAFARLDVDVMRHWGILAYEAELHGAIGIIFCFLNGYAQHPSGEALNIHNGMCRDTIPVIQVSIRDGHYLAGCLANKGEIEITLFSKVDANPEGTGYNVIGEIPGHRYPDRYLFVGAHYDAWFKGYWDNTSGVAGMLGIARGLVESEYQPDHTLVFVATDAEEFGAVDSIFDWLVGAHSLVQAHPEWVGQTTCCFNIDTLCLKTTRQLRFYGSAEMVGFMRQALAKCDVSSGGFTDSQPRMDHYVTPWTETYSWTYFGVPVVQPEFEPGAIKETHYHTQFDTSDILDFGKSNEAVRLYGSLLIRLDRLPVPPYDFVTRTETMRASIDWDLARTTGGADRVATAVDRLEDRARQVAIALSQVNDMGWAGLPDAAKVDQINQRLRAAVRYLLIHCSYLGGDLSHDVMYRHETIQRNLRILGRAIRALKVGDPKEALDRLTHKDRGLPGALLTHHTSYPTYYHYTVGAVNPKRPNLFWGKDRTPEYLDCWILIQILKDKLKRKVTHFGEELHVLQRTHEILVERLSESLSQLARSAERAAAMLPLGVLREMLSKST